MLRLLLAFPQLERSALAAKELCRLPGAAAYSLLVSLGRHLDLRGFLYKVRGGDGWGTLLRVSVGARSRCRDE